MNKLLISPISRRGGINFRIWSPRRGVETHSFGTLNEARHAQRELTRDLRAAGLQYEPYYTCDGFEQALKVAARQETIR